MKSKIVNFAAEFESFWLRAGETSLAFLTELVTHEVRLSRKIRKIKNKF